MADNTLHTSTQGSWLERRFALRSRGSTLRTECLSGITGFLAAAYLLVVIPGLLAVGGMDKGAATNSTDRASSSRSADRLNPGTF